MEFYTKNKQKIIFLLFGALSATYLLSLPLMQLFAALIILLWLFEKDKFKRLGTLQLLFGLFVIIRVISIFTSQYIELSRPSLYKDTLFYLSFFPFSYYLSGFDLQRKEKLMDIFVIASVLVSLIGIALFSLNIKPRAQSYMAGYGTFSTYLLVAFAFFIHYASRGREYFKGQNILTGAVILTGLVLALSRTDIGIAVMLMAGAFILKKIKFSSLFFILLLTAAFSAAAFSLNNRELNSRVSNPATLSDRNVLWGTAYRLAGEHPVIGFGPRTFNSVFTHRDQLGDKEVGSWHNDYITVYIESGAAGLIAFLLFILYLLKINLLVNWKEFKQGLNNTLNYAAFTAVAAMLLSAFFSGFVGNPILSVIFAMTAALSAGDNKSVPAGN